MGFGACIRSSFELASEYTQSASEVEGISGWLGGFGGRLARLCQQHSLVVLATVT